MNKRNRHIPVPITYFKLYERSLEYLSCLENSNYLVTVTFSIQEAIDSLASNIPYYFVIDSIDGFEFTQEIRDLIANVREISLDYTRIIVLTKSYLAKPETIESIDHSQVSVFSKKAGVGRFLSDLHVLTQNRPLKRIKLEARSPNHQFHIQLEGKIESTTTDGCIIEAPVKLTPESNVKVSCPLLEKLGIRSCVFRRTQKVSQIMSNGLFRNEFNVIGINKSIN